MSNFIKDDQPPSYITQALVLLGMLLFAGGLAQLISLGILYLSGMDIKDMLGMGEDMSANISLLKTLQLISALIIFILPAIAFSWYRRRSFGAYFLRIGKIDWMPLLLTGLCLLACYPILMLSMTLNSYLTMPESLSFVEDWMREQEDLAANLTEKFLTMETFGAFLFNMLLIGIIPAVGEELLFRGSIQTLLHKWFKNKHVAVIVAAFIFSFFHFQFYGLFPRWILGILLGYLYVWSENIWYPIWGHFLNNGMQVLLLYIGQIPKEEITNQELPIIDGTFMLTVALSSVLLLGLCYFYQKQFLRKHEPELG